MGMIVIKLGYHVSAFIRILIYKMLFGERFTWGKHTTFRRNFSVYLGENAKLIVGDNCFFNNLCSINILEEVSIGEGCLFGENVKIYDHNHRFSDREAPIKDQGFTSKPVTIGRHCWLGSNVVVLKGVHIGNNCVIGAGTVVAQNVPDNTLVTMGRELIMKPIRDPVKEGG